MCHVSLVSCAVVEAPSVTFSTNLCTSADTSHSLLTESVDIKILSCSKVKGVGFSVS